MLQSTSLPWRLDVAADVPAPSALRYASAASELGIVTIAADAHGVHAIFLTDPGDDIEQPLREAFPAARLERDDAALRGIVERVLPLLAASAAEQPAGDRDAPGALDPIVLLASGSPLRQRVWAALCEIPPGQTVSYTELAARVGRPDAVRAVAGAIAANRFAVLVPCHRVLRSDGSISGYRWGVERKRELLRRERDGR